MTIKGKAYIAGAYEHPLRKAPDTSTMQLHAQISHSDLQLTGHQFRLRRINRA